MKEYVEFNRIDFTKQLKKAKMINLDMEELVETDTTFAEALENHTSEVLFLLKSLIKERLDLTYSVDIRLNNIPDVYHQEIRDIRAKHNQKLIHIKGIIKQVSDVDHFITRIKYECPSCGTIIEVNQTEGDIKTPSKCSCGRTSNFKKLDWDLVDFQVLEVEESPDDIESNAMPRKIRVISKAGLCDTTKVRKNIPGTVVSVVGILKEKLKDTRKGISTVLGKYIEANNIFVLSDEEFDLEITDEEREEIKNIAKSPDAFDRISHSLAPSIFGYERIKRALALQLFGGVKHIRADKTATRENIHGLLIGDPGTGKSIMLRYMAGLTPRGRFVSGKGASGVGLTATVVRSDVSNGWDLRAGPIVMANGSICAIDEGDKMQDEDRSNLHECMSIGTLTISKATIQATLPARTSVLMGANPKYSRFKNDGNLVAQINLPSSLLSRFDFIYAIKDKPNEKGDRDIANKILSDTCENYEEVMKPELLRKYIFMSKQYNPKMSDEAAKIISEFYVELRKQTKEADDGSLIIPITARQLESIVRFSEAHARLKLRKVVGVSDAKVAIQMIKDYLREFGYDDKTKSFDIDKITGTSSSTRGRMDTVLKTVRQLEDNYADKAVPYTVIEARLTDMTPMEIEQTIYMLNRHGDLLKSSGGYRRT